MKNIIKILSIPMITFLLIIAANFPVDIHVPAMPTMARELSISTSQIQLSMSLFFFGYALFPLFFGSLSDAFGRRRVVLSALVILIIGTIVCLMAQSATTLLLGRFVQGIGAGGCVCLSRSIMRDSYDATSMAKVASLLGIGVELSLSLSPAIGGYLVEHYGWHSNFIFALVLSVLTILLIYGFMQETNQSHNKTAIHFTTIIQTGKQVLSNKTFLRYAFGTAAAFSSGMTYFTISPFVIQETLHYSAKAYGFFNLFVTLAIVLGSMINALCVPRFGIKKMVTFGLSLLFSSGLILLILALSTPISLLTFLGPAALGFFSLAFLFGNCMSGALEPFAKQSGLASSFYSMIQLGIAFMVTGLASFSPHDNSEFVALTFMLTAGLALTYGFSTTK